MLKVVFQANNITDLKLQIQEYGLTHLGMAFMKPIPPKPPEKRGPGRPRRIRPEDLKNSVEAANPRAITAQGLKEVFTSYSQLYGVDKAIKVLQDFDAFNVEEVKATDLVAVFKRLTTAPSK